MTELDNELYALSQNASTLSFPPPSFFSKNIHNPPNVLINRLTTAYGFAAAG